MAGVGVRKFQDLIGRTDLLKVRENNENPKARLLNLSLILKNALHMRPGVNIIGGSKSQVNIPTIYKYTPDLNRQILRFPVSVTQLMGDWERVGFCIW